jgi:dipeptidyl aminopeptidase/acylaminoacyl peptidase
MKFKTQDSKWVTTSAALAGLTLLGGLGVIGWWGSTILLRRRVPDPPDPPDRYGLAYEVVGFPSRDGIPLRGWWIRPPPGSESAEWPGRALVVCHGHNGSMDGDTAQAAALARAGFPVLLFNFRAHGGGDTASGGDQVTFGAREYRDVLGALDWLQAERGIGQAGLVGFSMGAGVALMVAAQDSRVAAVVADGTIARIGDAIVGLGRMRGLPAWLVQPVAAAMLGMASLRAGVWIGRADPVRWAGWVRCPVLFIHGENDPFVPMESVRALATRVGERVEVWIVPGAGHRDAYARDPESYYRRVTAFLRGI